VVALNPLAQQKVRSAHFAHRSQLRKYSEGGAKDKSVEKKAIRSKWVLYVCLRMYLTQEIIKDYAHKSEFKTTETWSMHRKKNVPQNVHMNDA